MASKFKGLVINRQPKISVLLEVRAYNVSNACMQVVALERPLSKLVKSSFRLEVLSVAEGEELFRRSCEERGAKYCLTVFSGLRRFYE